MLDGTVARKTCTVSEFGSKLDTIADFIFLSITLFKLISVLDLKNWIWTWIFIIAVIKTSSVILNIVKERQIVAFHSVLNKIAGLCLFILPLTLAVIDINYSGGVVCVIATAAAVHEFYVVAYLQCHQNKKSYKSYES